MPAVIEAKGLARRFKEITAVAGVDLDVARGEICGLVGPNGAGKTTLLHLLAGLLDPTAGRATVLGHDTVRDAAALRPRLGYVSQEFTLYGTLSVEENLDFFADLHGVPAAVRARRKEELLAWSRLAPFRDRRAGRLSGGMQKKLHLCSTLVHEPDVLLLDEPTTGVDPASRRELWEILYDLAGRGLTLVVATPYMDEAERCHRVALIERGRILRCDTPDALKAGLGARSMEEAFIRVVAGGEAGRAARRSRSVAAGGARAAEDALAVRLDGLTKAFGDFVAVDHVSLSVARGEVFGFLGPNGSGKTTTIKMLCGLLAPSAGRAEVLGEDIGRRGPRLKSRIGYMSQRFSLYNDLTVGENLAFFGRGYGVPPRRLAERTGSVLEMAGLGGEERRLARELSGGVKQRLALGCAVLHEPQILFLDEPTAGVDPLARGEFWDLIGSLAEAGTTVFVTTHYLDEAEHCHRLGLIYRGRLLAVGSPQALKDGMRAGVMLELECREPFRALRLLRSEPLLARASFFGSRLHVLVEDAAEAELLIRKALTRAGLPVRRLEPIAFSLEDLFVIFIDMAEQGWRERRG
ncbi:MAG: ABC transporter ATP-binding protein [Candidatus Rokubacteria bacterium]|nr:ABC transporter ATP-binding protein [Candidatus Rokubacteria bacterium]